MDLTKTHIGPADHGRAMSLEEFAEAEGAEGNLYELARGVIQVTEIPGLPHGRLLDTLHMLIDSWRSQHPGVIQYRATGDCCVLRLPGVQSERHPGLALYLSPSPDPVSPWERWIPDIVVEVVSEGGEHRDYEDKRLDYLVAGVREYWIIDPAKQQVLILQRAGDTFREVRPSGTYLTTLLPGFSLDIARLFTR